VVLKSPARDILRCSFCNKAQDEVWKLVAGPTVFICDECIDVCGDILADDDPARRKWIEERAVPAPDPEPKPPAAVKCSVCRVTVPVSGKLLILKSGVMCTACVGEVAALLKRRSQSA